MVRVKNKKTHVFMLILLLILGIGFAALAATLKINGTITIDSAKWDVHFENVSITEGSVTATTVPTSDDETTTEITYAVNFTQPGDFYEFTVDMVNDGTIDAMVNLVTNKVYAADGETEKQLPAYLKSAVTYDDGVPIQLNQLLTKQTREKIKVRVEFRSDVNKEDLPNTNETIIFKFEGKFKQADESGTSVNNKIYTPGQIVYFDPVTNDTCNENTYDQTAVINNESTCYKWRTIETNDKRRKNKVTIMMDHSYVNNSTWCSSNDCNYPGNALGNLERETSNWKDELKLNYTYDVSEAAINCGSIAEYNFGELSCVKGVCTVNGNTITTNLKARIITAEEIRALTMASGASVGSLADAWKIGIEAKYYFSNNNYIIGTMTSTQGGGDKSLSWLLENTSQNSDSGSTANAFGNNTYGYWTLSPAFRYNGDKSNYPLFINNDGHIQGLSKYEGGWGGLRPVIEIEKSKLS